MNQNYKYEVALSFLEEDQQLALRIADRIRDRVNVFLYTEKQGVFAGTDGVDQHSQIYSEESRVIVILYREGWGQTPWTRVEETAIKNRAFDEGHNFIVFVPLDDSPKPKWLPKTRIWVGFDRYGIDGIAGAIEGAVQAEGGTVRNESAAEFAVRVERELSFESERANWRSSAQGISSAKQEVITLFDELNRIAKEINSQTEKLQIALRRGNEICNLFCSGLEMQFVWASKYLNTLDNSQLYIKIIKAHSIGNYIINRGEPHIIQDVQYDIEMDTGRRIGWREVTGEKRFLTSGELADFWLKNLLNHILHPKNTNSIIKFRR
jgi:hypothetical protein